MHLLEDTIFSEFISLILWPQWLNSSSLDLGGLGFSSYMVTL